jgi:hypothetical protein
MGDDGGIGQRLRELREEAGLSLREVAKRADVNHGCSTSISAPPPEARRVVSPAGAGNARPAGSWCQRHRLRPLPAISICVAP